jgi:acetyl esterase/lipase
VHFVTFLTVYSPVQATIIAMAPEEKHEALQPLHPSMAGKLDPVFERLYNEHMANTPIRPIDLDVLRRNYSTLYSYGTGPAPEPAKIYDATVPLGDDSGTTISIRLYEPAAKANGGLWPVHVDFHGGGWGLGDLETEGHICKHICVKANVVVVDVGYRLVPEHPFPAAITDSWAVVQHIRSHGAELFGTRPDSISLGGVSAGGAIALALAHHARDAALPLRLVTAGAPVIDDLSQYPSAAASPWPSMRENEHAPTLNWARLAWFDKLKRAGMDDAVAASWHTNLLRAPDFSGLARTVVYTAGADPLRDEGEAYARRLAEAGSEVTLRRFPGVPHPFMHMDKDLWQGREFIDRTAREIRLAHWEP